MESYIESRGRPDALRGWGGRGLGFVTVCNRGGWPGSVTSREVLSAQIVLNFVLFVMKILQKFKF